MRILITNACDAKAYQIQAELKPTFTLFVDCDDLPQIDSPQLKMQGKAYQIETIAHQLLQLCLSHQIDLIVPIQLLEQEQLIKASILFNEYQIQIQLPE